ncbi:MAG: NAD(P)(+) transhydrogenase (Re/Si-specific) subunit beta [Chlorobi bacterium]|nr:NAD(P)(+) transhydrogenase (Re/Si-specific) subunit beta [Chlorobiota bacterium]
MNAQALLNIAYLIAAVTFMVGMKMLGSPKTARRGNQIAAVGMAIAVLATIFLYDPGHEVPTFIYVLIFVAIAIGTFIGWYIAVTVDMTKMPELVSFFNGMGGATAALIGLLEYPHFLDSPYKIAMIVAGLVIGSVSFAGSMVAWAKLNGTMRKPIRLPKYNVWNTLVLLAVLALAAYIVVTRPESPVYLYALFLLSLVYGVMFVIPIGGADMPVVISLLNSFTGLAAAFGGFLYDNMAMLTGGVLVGSAGTILTIAMTKAMNRSLSNVIFGAFGDTDLTGGGEGPKGTVKSINPSDAAILLNYAKNVIIVPGYGLAVAQAQHAIHELEELLESKGVNVKYAIHPVAGRMPGHMNVLLAEANVDYDKLVDMDDINPQFKNADVVLVVGANDVVNPAAKKNPASPIYGMPILDVEDAKNIIVLKRSMKPGYAGIDNELFYNPKTSMLFGDAKDSITKIINELKNM